MVAFTLRFIEFARRDDDNLMSQATHRKRPFSVAVFLDTKVICFLSFVV